MNVHQNIIMKIVKNNLFPENEKYNENNEENIEEKEYEKEK